MRKRCIEYLERMRVMAFQQPSYTTQQAQPTSQHKTLNTLASDFGTLLRTIRQRNHLSMVAVVASLPTYFEDAGVPVPSQDMYERMERDDRAPQYRELMPLYQSLVAGCGFSFSTTE